MYLLTIFLFLTVNSHVNAEDERELRGKVAVVTGGAKGIGYAITEEYLKAGVRNVTIVDKNRPRGVLAEKTLNSLYGNRVWFIHGDVTKDVNRVSNMIFKTFKCVHILVNNAGILEEDEPEKTIITNLLATVLWSHKFHNHMRKDRRGEGGTILNLASIISVYDDPFFWSYKSSKYGVLGFTRGYGHEYNYRCSGVRVIAICPGFTYTDMTNQQMVVDKQVEIFTKLRNVVPWQQPEAVGRGAVLLFKIAPSGSAYTVEGGEVFVTPDRINITLEFLNSL